MTAVRAPGQTTMVQTPNENAAAAPRIGAIRGPEVRATLLVILVLNAIVVAAKVAVGVRTGSLSVLGAALESGFDMLNNIVGIVLVGIAALGPDEDHPYGHEKFETLGALAIVGFLSISCFELLRQGVRHVVVGRTPRAPSITELIVVLATMGINIIVVWYERRRGRQLNSAFLLADAAHTGSDIYVTAAALASLVLARMGLGFIDPILAIAVALVIAWNGYQIVRGTVPVLVDQRAVDASEIRRLLSEIPGISDVPSVRSRAMASGVLFAEVTICVDAYTTVQEAHRIADAVEERLADQLGASEVTVHVEPG
ncbi:MAG TPA: cation diffusion facilitator family transporter [Gemmatimonadaceae bacterium]|nr:cation diffusion facilitator family transporter [Gemmatimonadaceae bacterium]